MPGEVSLPLPAIFGFLLVLARVSGVILFVPLPGVQAAPEAARIVLALALSFVLMPVWAASHANEPGAAQLPLWIAAEFMYGLLTGVIVAFVLEGVQVATQLIGLQAGYSFASTVDPSTQADSGVLQVISQLFTGILFFALGFDRQVIRALAYSLDRVPNAGALGTLPVIKIVSQAGAEMFVVGLRLALPVLAMLILMDLSFSLMGKVHAQFQVMQLSFAAKMLVGVGMLATALGAFPRVWQLAAGRWFELLIQLMRN